MHEIRTEGCQVSPGGGTMMDLLSLHDGDRVQADANNNGEIKAEKYSLRPRSLRQKTEKGIELKKEFIAQRCKKGADKDRPKQKPPPLSKYRRKTANARERNRMREINVAFETLRRAVPHIPSTVAPGNEKLTKITTLRLAMKYIQALRQALDTNGPEPPIIHESELDTLFSDADSFASPDHPLTSPFSDPSDNSPALSEHHDFPDSSLSFSETGIEFDEPLTDGDFCDDFLNSHCVGFS